MRHHIHGWMLPAAWFAAGIFATGAFWYFLSTKNYRGVLLASLGAIVFALLAIHLHRSSDAYAINASHRDQLSQFLTEAQKLRSRLGEQPLPVADHNAWVERVSVYLRENLGLSFEARFGDFSGMVFYGGGSEKSQMSCSLDGRSRRLHEFISELR
jgi:hypothetical protein